MVDAYAYNPYSPEGNWRVSSSYYLSCELLVSLAQCQLMPIKWRGSSLLKAFLAEEVLVKMESHYVMESGFYMTAFAATIFIGSLVTVGVLLLTLLISLTIMLQSCQSRSEVVVELQNPSYDYNYCKMFSLHAELNNLEPKDFPSICRTPAMQHINKAQYENDLNASLWVVERHFDSVMASHDGLDVVLMDIDDILPNPHYTPHLADRLHQYDRSNCFEEAPRLKQVLFLRLYMKLKAGGWSLILLSRKPENERNATMGQLVSAGYSGWSSVIFRLDNEMGIDTSEFFYRQKAGLQKSGFRIAGVISSRMDALNKPSLGERSFKLPNEMYYRFDHHTENTYLTE
ncbi:hypothetical protein Tsubulata_013446 [Turnera subulata]|uniref:Acid phosphatase n=1 Tax=Turnera subulata TaxID=218843 RepID=A0A9Q0JCW8_9ROSI|nr:hypothetical protein Tsubulata_013446 [Turnera subulata]